MYFNSKNEKIVKSKFNNYANSIKNELLDQIISVNSNSRMYFEKKYDELIYKYLDTINTLNYDTTCLKFVRDVYVLIPVSENV